MAQVIAGRMTADIEGAFVVFLIGARFNRPWKLGKAVSVARAMSAMIRELEARPSAETGYLGRRTFGMASMAQCWRSFEQLEAYARATDRAHWPAWVAFNRRFKDSRGDVGIWHETYLVAPGRSETLYSGMPPWGLGGAVGVVPATGRREAARMRLAAGEAGEA